MDILQKMQDNQSCTTVVEETTEFVAKRIQFSDLPDRKKFDSEMVSQQMTAWWADGVDDVDQCDDWKKYDNAMFKIEEEDRKYELADARKEASVIEQKQKRFAAAQFKNKEEQELYDQTYSRLQSMVDGGAEFYYVAATDRFYYYDKKSFHWFGPYKETAVRMTLQLDNAIDFRAFKDIMRSEGHHGMKDEITNSFEKQEKHVLNMMRTDHWLKPEAGEVHPMFEILIRSVGGHKQHQMDHLEQWMYWKYTHPEEFKLPALVLWGAGGAGKNRFGEWLPTTIFGRKQARKGTSKDVFGDFNAIMAGTVVVMVDEAEKLYEYRSKIKANITNRTVTINEKHEKAYDADVTAATIIAGNTDPAGALLDGSSVDRRFSLIQSTMNIYDTAAIVLSEQLGEDVSLADAKKFYDAHEDVYNNGKEVARWLHHIFEKWGNVMTTMPEPLHGVEYRKAVDDSKSVHEQLFDAVFLNRPFTHIATNDLNDMYRIAYKSEHGGKTDRALGKTKLRKQCEEWLKIKQLDGDIVYGQKSQLAGGDGARMVFHRVDVGLASANRELYIIEASRSHDGVNTPARLTFDIEVVVDRVNEASDLIDF